MHRSGTIFVASGAWLAMALIAGAPQPAGQDGPWNHRVLLATSADGLNWKVQPQSLVEHASVPELFLGPDGRPIVVFVDAREGRHGIGAMKQTADGSWQAVATNLREVDPNIVRLGDGSYRAYVKAGLDGAIAAYASTDGLNWRPLGEVFRDSRYRNATDPDVFRTPQEWVMLVSLGPRLLRCTSKDGLTFTTDGTTVNLGGSVSDTAKVTGGWRTFFHVNADPRTGGKMRIRSAFTRDGKTWQVEDGDRVTAPDDGPASLGVADPAPLELPDGSWLMALKSFIVRPVFTERPDGPRLSGGIAAHHVHSATSKDGLTWTRDEGIRISRASVPCAINDNDKRVLVYFVQPPDQPGKPETVACAISTDGTRFEQARGFHIEGLSTLKAVDPSILKDDTEKFRLYYLASNHRGDPAMGPNPHAIHLALSNDGIHFRETGSVFERDDLVDPDVFRFNKEWFMYVFARHATLIARSADGNRFRYETELSLPGWGTTAPLALAGGRLRLYAFDQRTHSGNTVRSFISTDGVNWTAEPGERLRANPDEQITDPFVIPWRGGFKMYFKSSPALRPRDDFRPPPGNQDGPWNRDVIVYRASSSGTVERSATFERAGVPTITRLRDGRLLVAHQHFPENDPENFDKVAVRFSSDDGRTWTAPQVIRVSGFPDGMRFPFDPTLVALSDGRVRLYFTSLRGRRFNEDTPAIFSAISEDGAGYTFEPGVRFSVAGRTVIDCAVVLHQGVFHLFVPHNGESPGGSGGAPGGPPVSPPRAGAGYHAVSRDGLNFTRMEDVSVPGNRRWLGNAFSDGGQIRFIGTGGPGALDGGARRGTVWMAGSNDGSVWQLVDAPAVSGGDPGAVRTRDGGFLVVITGESRTRK
jgi:hypothetical protein